MVYPDCKKFMEKVEEIAESQEGKEEKDSGGEATSAAGLLEKLTVKEAQSEVASDKKEEENPGTEKKAE